MKLTLYRLQYFWYIIVAQWDLWSTVNLSGPNKHLLMLLHHIDLLGPFKHQAQSLMAHPTYPIFVSKENMGKTCPSLFNSGDTRCRLMPHPILQVDQVALQVSSHIGWVCFLDCPSYCLVSSLGTHHSATTSYLSVSFIHELYLSGQPFHRTKRSFVPSGRVRLCKTFSFRHWLFEISCSSSGYQLPFTASLL